MQIVVDTGPFYGLLNKNDAWHKKAELRYRLFTGERVRFLLPRVVLTEFLIHATRELRNVDKELRKHHGNKVLDNVRSLGWQVVEHIETDFALAEKWWRQFADWPVDYPDALVAAVAQRLDVDSLWTFDASFGGFLGKSVPKITPIK